MRNTPTGVGKTLSIGAFLAVGQKHPHGRGEDLNNPDDDLNPAETPPRAWGRHYWPN